MLALVALTLRARTGIHLPCDAARSAYRGGRRRFRRPLDGFTPVAGQGVPQRIYRFTSTRGEGRPRVTVVVRIPVQPVNGGQRIPEDFAAGILMNRVGGTWFATRCGITDPGAVLAEVDEPRGTP